MQRVTITLDDDLMAELEQLMALHGYDNRSEAIRDLTRAGVRQALLETNAAPDCVAVLSFVSEPGVRDVGSRIGSAFHGRHDVVIATMNAYLAHDHCLQVAVLKGSTADVQEFGNHILAERGVRHGRISILPADIKHHEHRHPEGGPRHTHVRLR